MCVGKAVATSCQATLLISLLPTITDHLPFTPSYLLPTLLHTNSKLSCLNIHIFTFSSRHLVRCSSFVYSPDSSHHPHIPHSPPPTLIPTHYSPSSLTSHLVSCPTTLLLLLSPPTTHRCFCSLGHES